jgi:O-antigen ligase
LQFVLFASFIVVVALMGGGARSDISSLLFLRPFAVVVVAYGALTVSRSAFGAASTPLYLLLGAMVISALQLVPLPEFAWTSLTGRAAFAQVHTEFGIPAGWHSLSLYPSYGWNSLFAMFVPLAAILLLAKVDDAGRSAILTLFVGLAVASATLGILQLLGPSRNPFYLYRITNFGDPVGLFANRNHQAVFLACAFPIMAAYVGLPRAQSDRAGPLRAMVCAGIAAFLLASIVATGSRSGTLVAVISIMASFLLVPRARWGAVTLGRKLRVSSRSVAIVGVAGTALLLLMFSARLTALQRFVDLGGQDEVRIAAFKTNFGIAKDFFPWGTGMGTFPEIFAIYEPADFLDPQYLNHAHNDWIEIVIEGGLPATILLCAAIFLIGRRAVSILRKPLTGSSGGIMARLGLVVIVLLAIASVFDYPVRTPMISVLFMVALFWLFAGGYGQRPSPISPGRRASGRVTVPDGV